MVWHSHLSLDRKGHFVKIGGIMALVSFLILYGAVGLESFGKEKWWSITDPVTLLILIVVFIIGIWIFIKGIKMAVKKRGG